MTNDTHYENRRKDDSHPAGALTWSDNAPAGAQLTDLMIDIEALGTTPGAAILSIGAVQFGLDGLGDEFYAPVLLESCTAAGLTIDPRTLAWWMKQSDAARAAAFRDDAEALAVVLYRFTTWFNEHGAERPWCHGATFDVPLLDAAYKACGMTPPWKYWAVRDTRTLYDQAGVRVDRARGTHHNALDDARAQAEAAVVALRRLQGVRQQASGSDGTAADLAAKLTAAVDAEYPIPDNPHASVIQRATDNRAAMWRGINAARRLMGNGIDTTNVADMLTALRTLGVTFDDEIPYNDGWFANGHGAYETAASAASAVRAAATSGSDSLLESAVQTVAARAGESERIDVVSAFDAIRSLKTNRHALPVAADTSGSELAPDERALAPDERALPPLPEAEKNVDVWVADSTKRNGLLENKTCEANGEYFTDDHMRAYARAALAQQAVAPAGWASRRIDNGEYGSWLHSSRESAERHDANNGPAAPKYETVALYAAPSPSAEEDQDAKDAARWSKEPPTEQGEYWNWDGDEDHAPMIYHVLWSGTAKKCFVSIGQYDIKSAIWCDEFGGWWLPIEQPSTRDAAMSQAKGAGQEGAA